MSADARFEDAFGEPLALIAADADDLRVISALVQDAVLQATEMRYLRAERRFAALINRFRWEAGDTGGTAPERVQSLLVVGDVTRVRSQGIDPRDRELVLSVLALDWAPGEDGCGRLVLTLAGDGAVAIEADCLDVTLKDVTRPYSAPSGRAPEHD